MVFPLPTDIVDGQAGHAALHNDTNGETNNLVRRLGASPLRTTDYYASISSGSPAPLLLSEGVPRGGRFVPGRSVALDRIGCEVTTAGSAGALLRLGIYRYDIVARTWALLLDAGTVAADSLGFKEITINQSVGQGDNLLLVACAQGAPTTPATVRANVGLDTFWGHGTAATISQFAFVGAQITGATPAALPASPSLTPQGSGQVPRVLVRTSA